VDKNFCKFFEKPEIGLIAIFKAEDNTAVKWWRRNYEGRAGAVLFQE